MKNFPLAIKFSFWVPKFYFLVSKITADGDCSHVIKKRLLLERKVMTKLDNILKSRNIELNWTDLPNFRVNTESESLSIFSDSLWPYRIHGILQARIQE